MSDQEQKQSGAYGAGEGITALVVFVVGAFLLWRCTGATDAEPRAFDWNDALTMCQMAVKQTARDPETAKVPYVENFGKGDEFYFAWGASTKYARMRNGLGLEVPVSASCIVDGKLKRITSLTINGEAVIDS